MAAQIGASTNLNVDTNLLNMEWHFHEWIMGVGGLNPDNVLDYFALSPFWDPECNNAVLRMQTQFNNLGEMKQRLRSNGGGVLRKLSQWRSIMFYKEAFTNVQTCRHYSQTEFLYHVESAFNEARVMTEFHPSTGYHWKSALEGSLKASGTSAPSVSGLTATASSAGPGLSNVKAESQDFRIAVDRAIKNVEQRAHMQQLMLQAGNISGNGASASAAATDSKIKQEGTGSRSAPKSATKRRKKSEEASVAAASMGINTNVGAAGGSAQGRPVSAGGANQTSASPATPTATSTKRRKKTKNTEPK
ncbi:Mediator of RNA polymerase II transcription subunit 6 [Haplosporangium sp. Z 11]|nr:Mediator of RNA polymerase II transcription subunit 6 [Haplosporangium sp. Z 11]